MQLKISIFTNAGTVPLELAERRGFFAEEGLNVSVTGTTSSIDQMTGVIDGRFDIAATAIDNVIAYNAGQGAAPTKHPSRLKVFMGSASYRLPFVVAPDIADFSDLRGARIAVDALSTGFAFLLRDMLRIGGLNVDDYELIPTGAPKERWQAIRNGEAKGALLNAFLETEAHGLGFTTLMSEPNPWDGYQGNAFCAGPDILANPAIDGFRRAVQRAVDVVLDPTNSDEVAHALQAHLGDMLPDRARRIAQALSAADSILTKGLPVSRAGTETVIQLRETYTGRPTGLSARDLFDPRAMVVA